MATSPEGVIGLDNAIPWRRPADLKRFKALTLGGTVIMGRKTYASIGRPLPERTNVVLSRSLPQPKDASVQVVSTVEEALRYQNGPRWVIGGRAIYDLFLAYCDFIDVTLVPDSVDPRGAVLFPALDPETWCIEATAQNPEDPGLWHRRLIRIGSRESGNPGS